MKTLSEVKRDKSISNKKLGDKDFYWEEKLGFNFYHHHKESGLTEKIGYGWYSVCIIREPVSLVCSLWAHGCKIESLEDMKHEFLSYIRNNDIYYNYQSKYLLGSKNINIDDLLNKLLDINYIFTLDFLTEKGTHYVCDNILKNFNIKYEYQDATNNDIFKNKKSQDLYNSLSSLEKKEIEDLCYADSLIYKKIRELETNNIAVN